MTTRYRKNMTMSEEFNEKNKPPPVPDKYRIETFNRRSARQSASSKDTKSSDKSSRPPLYDERNAFSKGGHRDSNKYTDFSSEHFGLIYILKSKAGGLVKVGETTVNAESRLKSYAKAHDLEGFSVHSEYYVPREQRQKIEKLTHTKLSKFRVRMGTSKEIFECTPEIARQALFDAFIELDIEHEHFESEIKRAIDSLKRERERKQKIEEKQRRVEEEKRRLAQQEYEEKKKIEQEEKLSAWGHYSLFFGCGLFFLVLFEVIDSENLMVWFLIFGSVIIGIVLRLKYEF